MSPSRTAGPTPFEHLASNLTLAMEAGFGRLVGELAGTRDAVRLRGCEARPLTSTTGGNTRVSVSPGRLVGFLMAEKTGETGATIRLYDGADVGGSLLGTITLAPGESCRDWFGPQGIAFSHGLHVAVTGAVEGSAIVGSA